MARAIYTTGQFIAAIPGTGGIITAIAKRVGCSWSTAKKFIVGHATVQQAYDDECQSVLDLAEAKTIELIKNGDAAMIRYYLSTKGKHRGYTERQEVTGEDSGPIKHKNMSERKGDDGLTPEFLAGVLIELARVGAIESGVAGEGDGQSLHPAPPDDQAGGISGA